MSADEPRRAAGRPPTPPKNQGTARGELASWLQELTRRREPEISYQEITQASGLTSQVVGRAMRGESFPSEAVIRAVLNRSTLGAREVESAQSWIDELKTLDAIHGKKTPPNIPLRPWEADENHTDEPTETEPEAAQDPATTIGPSSPPVEEAKTEKSGRPNRRSSRALLATLSSVVVVLGLALWLAIGSLGTRSEPISVPSAPASMQPTATQPRVVRPITVQNKVAIGGSTLRPDLTPAYMSSVPRPNCAEEVNHCKVPGTEMQSGDEVVADCVVYTDVVMVNYDLKDAAAVGNPDSARSNLWYHGTRNGLPGFISEVYIVDHDRRGLGLPLC